MTSPQYDKPSAGDSQKKTSRIVSKSGRSAGVCVCVCVCAGREYFEGNK